MRNSFFRAADDVFAPVVRLGRYTVEALADQGNPVTNILVENTTVSTSISNIANDSATLTIDGKLTASAPPPFAQVCGLVGNAARQVTVYAALAAGRHHIKVTDEHTTGIDNLRILWQGPGFELQQLSAGKSYIVALILRRASVRRAWVF